MSDIVERLRARVVEVGPSTTGGGQPYRPTWRRDLPPPPLQIEAADEIERLRAENARFRSFIDATAEPGDVADWCDEYLAAGNEQQGGRTISTGHADPSTSKE